MVNEKRIVPRYAQYLTLHILLGSHAIRLNRMDCTENLCWYNKVMNKIIHEIVNMTVIT